MSECAARRHGVHADDASAGYRITRCAHRGDRWAVSERVYPDAEAYPVVVYIRWDDGFPETSNRWWYEAVGARFQEEADVVFARFVERMLAGDPPGGDR